jgi:DNA-binding transcriptional MerR regulator
MNNIKSTFSIKDLENLSGIKAHTIRIWEKRYNILEPIRTDTNIRMYDLSNLQKLLNITLLNDYGYKISKIAKLTPDKIPTLVQSIVQEKNAKNHAISAFKISMMNFDQELFKNTYEWLISEKSFRQIFYEVFIPLMEELGYLWQTDTISPSHEHFISCLIQQKLLLNIEKLQYQEISKSDKVFVLSLPVNEIHELGLMYTNYEVLSSGYKSIYLGESVPIDSLKDLKNHFDNITFISYLTIQPEADDVDEYVKKMVLELGDDTTNFWFLGRMASNISIESFNQNVKVFSSIEDLVKNI